MTTPAAVTAAPAAPAVLPIDNPSGLETCDTGGCPANALWRIVFTRGELVLCGNHAVTAGFVPFKGAHAAYANENKSKGSDH